MKVEINQITTKNLMNEILKRDGTQELFIEPYQTIEILINHKKQDLHINEGPAKLILIYD